MCYHMTWRLRVKKVEDPNILVRKLREEAVGSVSQNFATLATGGLRERRQK